MRGKLEVPPDLFSYPRLAACGGEDLSTDLQILRDLESAGAIDATSITLPEGTEYPKVEALFSYFGKVSHALRWYVGDLINWGEGRYGDKIYQAAAATGLSEGTLQNYASVAGRVAPERRRETLSFEQHKVVAYLAPDAQERWLAQADEKGWTLTQLKELLRDEGLIKPLPQPQWGGLPQGEPEPAALVEGDAPAPTGAGPPAPPSTGIVGETTHASVSNSGQHALTLAGMRDRLGFEIEEAQAGVGIASPDALERERDALNWALERLAPEWA